MSNVSAWPDVRQRLGEFRDKAKESISNFSCRECMPRFCKSNRMIVLVVFIAIYIDNMLTTTVVPIVPNFLFQREHPLDYQRVKGDLNTPGNIQLCENIQRNTTIELDILTDNGTLLNETMSDPQVRELFFNVTHEKNCTDHEIPSDVMKKRSEEKLNKQSTRVGLLFASKSAIQLITNPFVGPLTNRLGYSIPMFTGFVIIFASTVVFAFGKSYWVLLAARAVQGVGSSCTTVSGMGLIADKYPDDGERGNAMAIALSGLALGVLIGPPFGGVLYEFLGKSAPFLFLAGLALMDGGLQLYAMKPSRTPELQEGASLIQLLKDPYILVAAGSITFSNMGIGMLEPTLPTFMLQTMHSEKWKQGIAFLPASISYMCGTIIFGTLALKMGRWLAAMIGMFVIGLALFVIPFSTNLSHLVVPNMCLGLAIGMVDSSMMPTMAYLVDLRHISVYGSVYAIADVAFCLGFAVGPAVGGVIVEIIGFKWMLWIIAITNIMYAPLLYFLRKPPGNTEKMQLVMNDKCPIKYVMYKQSSNDDDEESHSGTADPEPDITTEQTELKIEEYSGNGRQITHLARLVRKPVTSCNRRDSDDSDTDSEETDGADDSQYESSTDSEHASRANRQPHQSRN